MTSADRDVHASERLSRRRWLRGTGVAIGLPWLESLPVLAAEPDAPAASAAANAFPRRLGIVFMGCGVHPERWWAKSTADGMELSACLQPLAPLAAKLNVIEGLFNKHALGVGIHPGQTGNILSGAALRKGAELRGGTSVDQAVAMAIGGDDVVPSLVLGCEQPTTGYHDSNFSMAYSSHISWQNATSPVPMEVYPSLAFDSLFENRGASRDTSVLDRVREDVIRLLRETSGRDQAALDEYLTSIREVEQRIERQRAGFERAAAAADHKGKPVIAMPRPDDGLPEDIREHMRLMSDIVALAFQSNRTRVASLLLCRDLSGLCYPFLAVKKAHHLASHDDLSEEWARVTTYYVEQYAYLASRLDAMPEGDGTVLDHSCLMFINNMFSGAKHDASRVPLLTLGGLGGSLATGRVLDYREKPEADRRLCGFYLALMQKMGVPADHFGDATSALAEV